MADFTMLTLAEAQKRTATTRTNRWIVEYRGYLEAISGGRAGLLRPAEGETLRALALRLRRAAKEQGRPLTIHKAEGELVFWFAGAKLRGRPAKAADKT